MRASRLHERFPLVKSRLRPDLPSRDDLRFLVLDTADPIELRVSLDRLAASLRPGKGATNAGLTPKWYRDRVAILDALRTHLATSAAAEGPR